MLYQDREAFPLKIYLSKKMAKDKKIKITLIKSPIGYKEKAKKTIEALGLKKN